MTSQKSQAFDSWGCEKMDLYLARRLDQLEAIVDAFEIDFDPKEGLPHNFIHAAVFIMEKAGVDIGYRYIAYDPQSYFSLYLAGDLMDLTARFRLGEIGSSEVMLDQETLTAIETTKSLMKIPKSLTKWFEEGRYTENHWHSALMSALHLKGQINQSSLDYMAQKTPKVANLIDMAIFKATQAGLIEEQPAFEPEGELDELDV
jgi:hypothetical protein